MSEGQLCSLTSKSSLPLISNETAVCMEGSSDLNIESEKYVQDLSGSTDTTPPPLPDTSPPPLTPTDEFDDYQEIFDLAATAIQQNEASENKVEPVISDPNITEIK